jgi:DNA-binding NarL/FixJ family response regulator
VERLNLLLVDDQRLFVDNLKIVLESRTKDIRVVGIAVDGRDAVEKTNALKPDMILMDVRLPLMDGVEATRIILRQHPAIRIVMLTTFGEDEYVQNALGHGAVGYLLKSVSPEELINAIRVVRDGAVLISPEVAGKLLRKGPGHAGATESGLALEEARKLLDDLTPREKDIVNLISLAYDNRQIADRLHIAEQTAKNAIGVIFMKVHVERRVQLMRLVEDLRQHGLWGAGSTVSS